MACRSVGRFIFNGITPVRLVELRYPGCFNGYSIHGARFSTRIYPIKVKRRSIFLGITAGVGLGAGYSYFKMKETRSTIVNPGGGTECKILKELPNVEISKKIINPADTSGLKFILFQYTTCPFCCKVRAFLDFYGLSYDIVEVNPVMRQQLKWSDYRKVPILLAQVDGGYLQLNDSSMIISVLTSYLLDKEPGLLKVSSFYPTIEYIDNDGRAKNEILNRYFLMYQGNIPEGTTKDIISEERKWRKWADDVLVHSLSPNVYRTTDEAVESFKWFSDVGEWEKHFASWERYFVIYVGAFAMWIIGKRLKKKHQLKDDVRQSLYDQCNIWLRELKSKGSRFHGGSFPDLSDLAVFGVLSSIEGCSAFGDLIKNTKISTWYNNMKEHVAAHAGSQGTVMHSYRM